MVVHVRDTRLRYELFSGSQPVPSYAHLSQPPPLSPYVHWCVGASGVLGELRKTLLLEGVKPRRQPELGFGRVSTSQPVKEKGVMITQCQCQCQCQSVNMPLYQVHNPILAQSFSHNFQGREVRNWTSTPRLVWNQHAGHFSCGGKPSPNSRYLRPGFPLRRSLVQKTRLATTVYDPEFDVKIAPKKRTVVIHDCH